MYTDEQLEQMKKQWEAMGLDPEAMMAQMKLSQQMSQQMEGMMQNMVENNPMLQNMANLQASITLDDLFSESEPLVNAQTELSAAEQKAMLCAGNLSFYADQPMNDLSTGLSPEEIKMGLESAWGVENKKDLVETLEWLSKEGHTVYFKLLWSKFSQLPREQWMLEVPELVKQAGANPNLEEDRLEEYAQNLLTCYPTLQGTKCLQDPKLANISAWDLERCINLCRFGFDVGFFTKEEAMSHIKQYAEASFQQYQSWEALSEGFLLGCAMWSGNPGLIEDRLEMHQTLLSHEKSPWTKVKF